MKPLLLSLCLLITGQIHAQWQAQNANYPKPLQGFDIEAVNTNVAWTVGMTGDYHYQHPWDIGFDGHYFSRTTDGVHWNSGTFPSTGAGWTVNICALDANVAWIAFQDFGDGSHIFKTINGGANWANQPSPINTWIDFVHFWDNGAGLTMGDPDSLGFQIATSGNGGDYWQRVNPASLPAALPGEFGINDLYTVADNKVWFATNYGRVYYSPNKGYTWEVHDSGINATPDGITCGTNGHCLMQFGDYTDSTQFKFNLRHSSNFGATWEDATPVDNNWVIWGIQFVPNGSNKVIGVFRKSNVGPFETRVSSDNGLTWQVVDTGTPLLRLDFASPSIGWATEYKTNENPTRVFKYIGSPLVGLLSPTPLAANITLSPNPATDFIQVEVKNAETNNYWILLNDAQGHLIRKIEINMTADFSQKIDLKDLPKGVYTLTVSNEKGSTAKQIVKN